MSKGEKTDDISAANIIEQNKPRPSQAGVSSRHDQSVTNVDSDSDNVITIVNRRDTLRSFIEKSPLGVQFAIIVLFHLARSYSTSADKSISADQSAQAIDLSPFLFTSKEFFDA